MRLVPLLGAGAGAFWLTIAGACASAPARPPAGTAPSATVADAVPGPEAAGAACERIEHLLVRKAERVLVATCAGGAVRRLPVALARAPGRKEASGDQRVPEGDYRIAGPARPSRFHRFLPIDYPAPADAARALAEGRLSRADHDAIVAAHRRGFLPPQETPLGGHLGLHGEGRRWRGDLDLDWTTGCVALRDFDIDWIGDRAPQGTPIRIEP